MKKIFNTALLAVCLILPSSAMAESGVVISAIGEVRIVQGGKVFPAKSGSQFDNGAVIEVGKNSSAALMLSSGSIKKLRPKEKFAAAGAAPSKNDAGVIKGIAMAYNDATTKARGPVVHGMVKGVGESGGKPARQTQDNIPLPPDSVRIMEKDLGKIDPMGLDNDGRELMRAQVYYKYGQYRSMVETLLPVYHAQTPPSDMVKRLLALGYDKMGLSEEAKKFK